MATIPIDFERIVQEVYEAVLAPGMTAVDVGAHVGRHTLPMARCVGPTGRILAVEPLTRCLAELERLLGQEPPEVRDCVQLAPFALSDRPGAAELLVAEDWLAHSGLRETPYPTPTRITRQHVEVQTLDELCSDLDSLDFIKLDAEGAELHILRGAEAALERFRPLVAFEFGTITNRAFGVEPADMARFWAEHDYQVYALTGQMLTGAEFLRSAEARQIWDYIAVPAEDAGRNSLIHAVLNRARVNWLAVRAQLNHARQHAEVGLTVPPLHSVRGPLRRLARCAAWLFLKFAQVLTIPQRCFNNALLLALEQLASDLEQTERDRRRQERRVEELHCRLEALECRLSKSKSACTLEDAS